MARKSKRPRRSPAATPTQGGTDRDKAINALMSLLADHSFEQIGLAEVAGRAGIKLSQLRAEFGSTLAIFAAHIKEIDRAVLAGQDAKRFRRDEGIASALRRQQRAIQQRRVPIVREYGEQRDRIAIVDLAHMDGRPFAGRRCP